MAELDEAIAHLFRKHSCDKLQQMSEHMTACLARLSDDQVWLRGGDHENSIGNLILHMCGNALQWIMHGVAGEPDVRQRELEFSAAGGLSAAELKDIFQGTTEDAIAAISEVTAARLLERITPQGRDVSVLEAIYQVVGHVQMHVGQVILLTKQMVGEDLDLTIRRPRASRSVLGREYLAPSPEPR